MMIQLFRCYCTFTKHIQAVPKTIKPAQPGKRKWSKACFTPGYCVTSGQKFLRLSASTYAAVRGLTEKALHFHSWVEMNLEVNLLLSSL